MSAEASLEPFLNREDNTGFRSVWNCFPIDSSERAKIAIPTSAMYTPLKLLPPEHLSTDQPVLCPQCGAGFSANEFAL